MHCNAKAELTEVGVKGFGQGDSLYTGYREGFGGFRCIAVPVAGFRSVGL